MNFCSAHKLVGWLFMRLVQRMKNIRRDKNDPIQDLDYLQELNDECMGGIRVMCTGRVRHCTII